MGTFQAYQGVAAIFFMLIGCNILRRVSWSTAATFTPVMILFTGLAFFSCIIIADEKWLPLKFIVQLLSRFLCIFWTNN